MFQRILHAFILRTSIRYILQIITNIQCCIRCKTDEVVQRGHRYIIVVLRSDKTLLCIGQFDLRSQYIRLGHGSHPILRIDVRKMCLQVIHRLLIDADQTAILQDLEVSSRSFITYGLFGILKRKVHRIQLITRCIRSAFQLAARIKRQRCLDIIGKGSIITSILISLTAHLDSSRSPRQGRPHTGSCRFQRPDCRVHICHRLLDCAVIL